MTLTHCVLLLVSFPQPELKLRGVLIIVVQLNPVPLREEDYQPRGSAMECMVIAIRR